MCAMPHAKGGWCMPISVGLSGAAASVRSSHSSRAAHSSPWPAPGTTVSSITSRSGRSSTAYCTNPPDEGVPGSPASSTSRRSWLPGIRCTGTRAWRASIPREQRVLLRAARNP